MDDSGPRCLYKSVVHMVLGVAFFLSVAACVSFCFVCEADIESHAHPKKLSNLSDLSVPTVCRLWSRSRPSSSRPRSRAPFL